MNRKYVEELLYSYREKRNWRTFLKIIKELDQVIKKKVNYFKSWFRSESEEELTTAIHDFIYENVQKYDPARDRNGNGILRYLDYNMGSFLQSWSKKDKVRAYVPYHNNGMVANLEDPGLNSFMEAMDSIFEDLSESSQDFVDEIFESEEVTKQVLRVTKVKHLTNNEKAIKSRFFVLQQEVSELVERKSIKVY